MKKGTRGSTIATAAVLAGTIGILVTSTFWVLRSNTQENLYLTNMNQAFRLAETGMNETLGKLAVDPTLAVPEYTYRRQVSSSLAGGKKEEFESIIRIRDVNFNSSQGIEGLCYIMTTATRTIAGREYHARLHTYARVSNVGDFFAAINDTMVLSDGLNAANGRVYAPRITILVNDPTQKTEVLSVNYINPPLGEIDPSPTSAEYASTSINIFEPSAGPDKGKPVGLKTAPLFPQILPADLDRYKTLAGAHLRCDFTTEDNPDASAQDGQIHIFPPGYDGGFKTTIDDAFPADHGTDNREHVYYCDSDLKIKGTIHGQVLFVAAGDIHIMGDLKSAADSDPLPGAGSSYESTAHQAVLITRNTIFIDPTFYDASACCSKQTQTIQALLLAPNGSLVPRPYDDPTPSIAPNEIHANLWLNFEGSMILGSISSQEPNSLPYVFGNYDAARRTYSYMTSLKTHPPPYLPALTEVYFSLEDAM